VPRCISRRSAPLSLWPLGVMFKTRARTRDRASVRDKERPTAHARARVRTRDRGKEEKGKGKGEGQVLSKREIGKEWKKISKKREQERARARGIG